jgi:hypothetical protein
MAHVRRALTNALLAWATTRLPPPPEMLGWSHSAYSNYGTFDSFDYVSSTTRALPNALTVFLNALTARRMLSCHGEYSHGTENAPTNTHANAPTNAPVNAHTNATANAPANAYMNAPLSAPVSAPRALINAHRAEAFVIPTQGEATLTLPPL